MILLIIAFGIPVLASLMAWHTIRVASSVTKTIAKPAPIPTAPIEISFDWLRDYGPLWEPDTTAFWLEPSTDAERASWYRRYRPTPTQIAEDNLARQYAQMGLMGSYAHLYQTHNGRSPYMIYGNYQNSAQQLSNGYGNNIGNLLGLGQL